MHRQEEDAFSAGQHRAVSPGKLSARLLQTHSRHSTSCCSRSPAGVAREVGQK